MRKMPISQKVGIVFILLGFVMFVVGASFFTYQGGKLNPIINFVGMVSFFMWLPIIIIGLILVLIKSNK